MMIPRPLITLLPTEAKHVVNEELQLLSREYGTAPPPWFFAKLEPNKLGEYNITPFGISVAISDRFVENLDEHTRSLLKFVTAHEFGHHLEFKQGLIKKPVMPLVTTVSAMMEPDRTRLERIASEFAEKVTGLKSEDMRLIARQFIHGLAFDAFC